MTPDDAIAAGAMALFGEKYGDEVRVLTMGRDGRRPITRSSCAAAPTSRATRRHRSCSRSSPKARSVSGVRRIEALTGEAARQWLVGREEQLREAAAALKAAPDEVPARVAALVEDRKRLERELAEAKKALALGGGGKARRPPADEQVGGHASSARCSTASTPRTCAACSTTMKQRLGSGVAALVAVNDGRASVAVGVTDDLAGQFSAVDLVKAAVAALGGQGGGGRPDMAQGGGPDGAKADEALAAVRDALAEGRGLDRSASRAAARRRCRCGGSLHRRVARLASAACNASCDARPVAVTSSVGFA